MIRRVIASMVTTTSYGAWLPGDLRDYVQDGVILPANPDLLRHAQALLTRDPVRFSPREQDVLFNTLAKPAAEFGSRLTDASVESWHLHWIIHHEPDSKEVMIGRLKTRMRQALNRGRIWTDGYFHRYLCTQDELSTARGYIARPTGCRMIDGKCIQKPDLPLQPYPL